MVAITIRNVPEHVRDELAARAARSGRSLQEYLLRELEDIALHPDPEDWLEQVRARVRESGGSLTIDQILEAKDADRR
jgi:plasmid stability protein